MIQESIWILRRSAAVFGVIILVCAAAFYRDPQMVQQNMLTMVNKRLDRLTTQMDGEHKYFMLTWLCPFLTSWILFCSR